MATNTAVTSTTPSILSSPNEKGPYSIGFVYVNQSDVEVYVNGVKKSITTDYTFSSATQITFVANPTVSIEFRRNSDLSTRSVDFNDGSVLTESDLDSNTNQILYAQQEIINDVATKTGTETLTNKTLTTPDINTPDIDGGTIDGATISSCTINNNVTGNLTGNVTGNVTGNLTGAVTGNASTATTAGTVTTAAQTNITSVGTLTGLTVSGTSAFNDHIDIPTDKEIRLGDNDPFTIEHSSSHETSLISSSRDLEIWGDDIDLYARDGGYGGSGSVGKISISSNQVISIQGKILPQAGNTFDLGATGTSWKDLYLSGNITVGGTVDGKDVSTLTSNTGTVTSITAGTGLSGGAITGSGTIDIADTAVTAGSYTNTNITVDAQGRITSAASGTVSVAAADLTGTTLASGVTASSLTSVGTLSTVTVSGTTELKGIVNITNSSGGHYLKVEQTNGQDAFKVDAAGNITVVGDIVTTSNGDIELDPNGSGKVIFKGNATKGAGQFVLNCENNSHGIVIKGPPHSAAASYTLTLPDDDGSANQVLKTDGSGVLSWVDQSGGGSYANSDVDSHLNISGASSGQILSWNGSDYAWVADQTSSAGGANTIHMNDNVKITFGDTTTPDLEILHSGSEASIKNITGNLTITNNYNTGVINLNPQEGRKGIMIEDQGAVYLYYDAPASSPVAKFETTSDGATVTGDLLVTSQANVTGKVLSQISTSGAGLELKNTNTGNVYTELVFNSNISGTQDTTAALKSKFGSDAQNSKLEFLIRSSNAMATALTLDHDKSATFAGAVSISSKTVTQTATAVAALEIDCAAGNYFTKAISASSAFGFSNAPASGEAYGFVLEVDVTGSSTAITWPTAVKWPSGTAPTLTDTKTHVFTFATVDGGTTWRASSLVDYTT